MKIGRLKAPQTRDSCGCGVRRDSVMSINGNKCLLCWFKEIHPVSHVIELWKNERAYRKMIGGTTVDKIRFPQEKK